MSTSNSANTSANNEISLGFASYPVRRSQSPLKTYGSLLQNGNLADVIFEIGGKYIPAHRLLLAARSTVFERMFYGPAKLNDRIINILDSSADTFERMLMYIYTNEVTLQKSNVVEIMLLAHKYELTFLEDQCEQFILRCINYEETVLYYDTLFRVDTFFSLKERLLQHICDRFIDMKTANSLLAISEFMALRQLIERLTEVDCCDVGQLQFDLFEMLINWGRFQCNQLHLKVTANNIRETLNGVEQLLDFRQMTKALFTKCMAICPSFFKEDESNQFYAHLKKQPIPVKRLKLEEEELDSDE